MAGVAQVTLPFERMGVPPMAYVVGLLEIAGAVGLLMSKIRFMAAFGLSTIMVGAIGYHMILDPDKAVIPAIILFILTGFLAWRTEHRKEIYHENITY